MRRVVDLPQPDGPTRTTNSSSRDGKVDAVHHLMPTVALDDFFQLYFGHFAPQPLTPPKVSPAMRCFWIRNVTTNAGTMISTAMAHIPTQSMVNCEV